MRYRRCIAIDRIGKCACIPWAEPDKGVFDEERPRAVEKTVIPEDQPFAWANDKMGEALAGVFDQDLANLPHVQTGMKASANGIMELGHYQDSRVRHFQTTLMKYINGELPG